MKKYLLFILIACISTFVNAQFKTSNLTFGGGVGLQFGDYTLINAAPQVGYNITNYLNAGAGVTYTYFSRKYDSQHYKLKNNYLGINLYARFYPIPYTVLLIQPEINRMWQTIESNASSDKIKSDKLVPVCLVGAGVRLGAVTAMLQYDVAQNENSPYGSRIFYSVGYTFGF